MSAGISLHLVPARFQKFECGTFLRICYKLSCVQCSTVFTLVSIVTRIKLPSEEVGLAVEGIKCVKKANLYEITKEFQIAISSSKDYRRNR